MEARSLRQAPPGPEPAGETAADLRAAGSWPDYEYLDSGDGRRLERFGPVLLDRPAPQALWRRHLPEECWSAAEARFLRRSDGGGDWVYTAGKELTPWQLRWRSLCFEVHPTGFGHLGLFPEQLPNWAWLEEILAGQARQAAPVAGRPMPELLNLFAYTGAASMAAARGGARVTHLDAVRGVVQWAAENVRRSDLGGGEIRWIVDDAGKFVKRELRRGRRYEAIVLDPPSFGRGSQGQVFKLEEDLAPLLEQCFQLLSPDALLLLVSAHTPGVTPAVLRNLLLPLREQRGGLLTAGEMLLVGSRSPRELPSGVHARWVASR